MEENSKCEHCKKWKEEIYWEHFSSIHFFLNLTTNFHDYLVLPEKFTAHMKSHLPDKVFLKGPSGTIWEIELLKSDSLLLIGNGWKDFVKVNKLKENCVLVFKFKRNSSFEVLIFDQGSSCEKEATYFPIDDSSVEDSASAESNKSKKVEEAVVSSGGLVQGSSFEKEATYFAIDNSSVEDSASAESNSKSKKVEEAVVSSGGLVDTEALRKQELDAAAKARGVTRRILPHRSSIKRKVRFGTKSFRNQIGKEWIQNSQGDVIILENDEIFEEQPNENHKVMECSPKLKPHSEPVHTRKPPLQVYIRRKKQLETQDKEGKMWTKHINESLTDTQIE